MVVAKWMSQTQNVIICIECQGSPSESFMQDERTFQADFQMFKADGYLSLVRTVKYLIYFHIELYIVIQNITLGMSWHFNSNNINNINRIEMSDFC